MGKVSYSKLFSSSRATRRGLVITRRGKLEKKWRESSLISETNLPGLVSNLRSHLTKEKSDTTRGDTLMV